MYTEKQILEQIALQQQVVQFNRSIAAINNILTQLTMDKCTTSLNVSIYNITRADENTKLQQTQKSLFDPFEYGVTVKPKLPPDLYTVACMLGEINAIKLFNLLLKFHEEQKNEMLEKLSIMMYSQNNQQITIPILDLHNANQH